MIELMSFISIAVAAVLIGFFASMMGVGGGIFIVPMLTLIFSFPPQLAVGTSITAVFFTSISSSLVYFRKKLIDYRLGLILIVTSLVGVRLGALSTSIVESDVILIAFGILLIYPSLMMISGRKPSEIVNVLRRSSSERRKKYTRVVKVGDETFEYGYSTISALLLGLGAGFASGFLGIGGGTIMVPSMVLLLDVPMIVAVATSLFVMIPTSALGALTHFTLGNVNFGYAIPLIIGVFTGAQIGARTAQKVPSVRLRQIFGVLLLYASIRMILSAL
ncbi:MAG: uncharacterized protein PWR13_1243 [Archaeoglobi archaeon]|nr:uncharacterized protein [Archaeoglobi archaeon]MDK2782215.1 uncharacterized protein [Archaeoglobi archaeon]